MSRPQTPSRQSSAYSEDMLTTSTVSAQPISPTRSIASLPSPPSSPPPRIDQSSIPGSPSSLASDLPMSSLSSSLFLSGDSSPGLHPSSMLIEDMASRTLVIPSLTIPRHDTSRGDTIGNVKLWIVACRPNNARAAAERMLLDGPLISHVDEWKFMGDNLHSLRATTSTSPNVAYPSSQHDRHRNVEIIISDLPEERDSSQIVIDSIVKAIQLPFHSTDRLLNDSEPSTTSFLPLLTSSTTQLHTALVLLISSPPTNRDINALRELSTHIPLIVIPSENHPSPIGLPSSSTSPALSSLRPSSLEELRDTIFLNPASLERLRIESAERFLRWRDINTALRQLTASSMHSLPSSSPYPYNDNVAFRPTLSRARTGTVVATPHARGGDETTLQREWMWNWEGQFARDVHDLHRHQQMSASGTSQYSTDYSTPGADPLARTIRGRRPLPPIPDTPADLSPSRSGDDFNDGNEDRDVKREEPVLEGTDDPLHLRSVARLAASLLPPLIRRFVGAAEKRAHSGRRRSARLNTAGRLNNERGEMSWTVFGLGVGVGVVVSICIVGLGLEISNRVRVLSPSHAL